MKALIAGSILLFTLNEVALAQAPHPQFETILVPIVIPPNQVVPGAYGSEWTGEVWMRNGSDRTVGQFQSEHGCASCSYAPGAIDQVQLVTWQSAAHMFVRREDVDRVSFNARLFELSRRSQPQGVEVPIIRERDLLVEPVHLLGLPISDVSRASVRIFDPFPTLPGSFFEVQVLAEDGGQIGSTVLQTRADPELVGLPGPLGHAWTPAFAMIPDLRLAFPQLVGHDRVHVRVARFADETPSQLYWTMASVTDNETQHVLLVTPQCCSGTQAAP